MLALSVQLNPSSDCAHCSRCTCTGLAFADSVSNADLRSVCEDTRQA